MEERRETSGPQWQALNAHMAERRAEETEDMSFRERAEARCAALVEGFWKEMDD